MSYIKNHLIKNEEIINITKPHWVLFLLPGILIALGIFDFFSSKSSGIALLVLGILLGIRGFIWYSTSEFGITINGLIKKLQQIEPEYANTFIDFLAPSNRSIELADVYAEHPDSNVQLIFNICNVEAAWKKEREILNG